MPAKPAICLALFIALLLAPGCRTPPPPAAINLAEAGWKVRQGQAVWRSGPSGEIAGELLVATHPDGRSLVQFTKTPVPVVLARTWPGRWEVHYSGQPPWDGYGPPPSRVIWLHLAKFLDGGAPPSRWKWERRDQSWKLENPAAGESIEGFVAP